MTVGISVTERDVIWILRNYNWRITMWIHRILDQNPINYDRELNTFHKTALGALSGPNRGRYLVIEHQVTMTLELLLVSQVL